MSRKFIRAQLDNWLDDTPCVADLTKRLRENEAACALPYIRTTLVPNRTNYEACRYFHSGIYQISIFGEVGSDCATGAEFGPFQVDALADCLTCEAISQGKITAPDAHATNPGETIILSNQFGEVASTTTAFQADGAYQLNIEVPYRLYSCTC